jgi:cyclically-permuted mutarotase family protein
MITSCQTTGNKSSPAVLHFSWRIAGVLPSSNNGSPFGLAGPVTGVSNDKLFIGGGANFPTGFPWNGGKKVYHDSLYVFEKQHDSLVALRHVYKLPYPLAYSANCPTDEGIVAAGGENENGIFNKVLRITWDNRTQKPAVSFLPDLPLSLTNSAIAFYDHKIYIAGGQSGSCVSNKFYCLDLKDTSAGWETLPDLPHPVSHAVLYVQGNANGDECIYLVGGRQEHKDSISDLYKEVYQFDLKTDHWSQKASLPYPLSAFTGISWGDSSLLVFSGDEGKTFHATEVLLMKIAKEKDPAEKQKLIAVKNELQKNHPGYNGNVLLYNTHTNKWIKTDSIPFPGQVTTTAVKWGNEVIIPCGEIRAGVRTPDIVAGKVSE